MAEKCPICGSTNTDYETETRTDVYGSEYRQTKIVCKDCGEEF